MAHARTQAPRHFHQQFVAGDMTERVVDDLEAVQVDQQQAHLMAQAPRVLERTFGAPHQLAPVGQAGERIEVGQMADLVLGQAPVGHVLDDAGVADQVAVLVELRLGLGVHDALAAVRQGNGDVGRQHRAVAHHIVQDVDEGAPVFGGQHAQHALEIELLPGLHAEHTQPLDREHRAAVVAPPVEAAHAGKILRAGQLGLAALELLAGARGTQQVAQPPGQQAPLVGLDEEVGGADLVGAVDGGIVVQAGEHQHRHGLETRQVAHGAAGLEAVHAGHQGVEHHHVGQPVGQDLDGALAAGGFGDGKTPFPQGDRGQ